MPPFNFENPFSRKSKNPEFKAVGSVDKKEKKEVVKNQKKALHNHADFLKSENIDEVEKFEYGKTEEEIKIINLANKEINKLMKRCGVSSYDIPLDNYHLISGSYYKEKVGDDTLGVTYFPNQIIALNADVLRSGKIKFFKTAVHETFHLKGKFVIEVEKDGEKVFKSPFREGISIYSSQKKQKEGEGHVHFSGVHEAIAAKATKEIVSKNIKKNSFFKEGTDILNSENEKKEKERGVFKEEDDREEFISIGYKKVRKTLNYVCKEVCEKLPEDYPDQQSVFDEFLKAHFSGKLLPLAKAVEKTFGKGSFRILGNMGTDGESALLTLETLRKKEAKI